MCWLDPSELPLLGADDIPRGLQLLGQTDEVLSEEDAELPRTGAWHYPGGGGYEATSTRVK